MQHYECAVCSSAQLKAPRLVDGAWYALCVACLFETEMEHAQGEAPGEAVFRVKGVAEMTAQQLADLNRPRPTESD